MQFRTTLANFQRMLVMTESWFIQEPSDLPILRDIKRPFELQMGVVVVIHEFRDRVVMATSYKSRGGLFLLD